eukprot:390942-Rhodomonas_salina.1
MLGGVKPWLSSSSLRRSMPNKSLAAWVASRRLGQRQWRRTRGACSPAINAIIMHAARHARTCTATRWDARGGGLDSRARRALDCASESTSSALPEHARRTLTRIQ